MDQSIAKILVVEDDRHLGFLLTDLLRSESYRVDYCANGQTAWEQLSSKSYDLCILDVMMPGVDGFELAQKITAAHQALPFLFITAKTQRQDKIQGLRLGAEDYITKPFDDEELLLRIKVILRRTASPEMAPRQFQLGRFFFDYELQELRCGEQLYRLTEKENEVLYQLCLHKNKILKRELAVEAIYGKKDYFLGRSFDVFISKIRKLLQEESKIRIENVYKVGFIFHVEE
ncbi:MAG TPA: response regulator transcription factor [Saprospiraceae bacterium]|nr:response regulator transcription factor [Saprospiraceae bacterium]